MKKAMEKNDGNIFKFILDTIIKYNPIEDNRIDRILTDNKSRFELIFSFFQNEEKEDITQIQFCSGSRLYRKTTGDWAIIEEAISLNLIDMLIAYILKDHSHIETVSKTDDRIYLSFKVNLGIDDYKGLPCNTIALTLDFTHHELKEKMSNYYMQNIVSVFYEKIKTTEYYQQEIKKYVQKIKNEYLKTATADEIIKLLSHSNLDVLKEIIEEMNPSDFMTAYCETEPDNIRSLQF